MMKNKSYRFQEKVVLITGGATGIGRITAIRFAEEGAKVVIGDVDDRAQGTIDIIRAAGGEGVFVKTDVVDAAQIDKLMNACIENYGRIDCAFNNAGILPPTVFFHEVKDEDFDKIIAVDVKGVFNSMRAQIRYMMEHGGGAIVNTASVGGVIADPGMCAYVAAKHAVVGLTKSAAIEYGAKGIRVNAIAPGFVETPMTQRWVDDPNFMNMLIPGIAMGRAAKPEEIAGTVLHLCSDDASYTNGQIAIIDGGQTAH